MKNSGGGGCVIVKEYIYIQGMSSLRSLIHFTPACTCLKHQLITIIPWVHSSVVIYSTRYFKLSKNSR